MAGLLELAVILTCCVASLDGPGAMPERFIVCGPASSSIAVGFGIMASVGGSLSGSSGSRNVVFVEPPSPSDNRTVINEGPNSLGAGVMVRLRFEPVAGPVLRIRSGYRG